MSQIGFGNSNSIIKSGRIHDSDIDMNGKVITNHNLPVNGTDVANKNYVDSHTGIISLNITLSGIASTAIILSTSGDFEISVKNIITNGPSAKFFATKNDPSRQAAIQRFTSAAGTTTNERLNLFWPIGDYIYISKDGVQYDGTYSIKYIGND